MSITAIVENDTIKLPMHVPDGTRVEITASAALPDEPAAPSGWPLFGLLKGKMTMADDFDEPLEDFRPYME